MAPGIAFTPGVKEIGRRSMVIQTKPRVGKSGDKAQCLILHAEVPQTVKNRFSLIELHTQRIMRAMTNDDIRSLINTLA
jgi:hypothetical protein